ncbi:MAG: hypothetical protein WA705_27510 [Candidatus Ozemobacteraceae bacterium]
METTVLRRPRGFGLLAGYFFLLKGIDNLLLVLLTSLFLKGYGPAGLPWFYVGANILFISSQLVLLRIPTWKGHRFLFGLSRPLILFSAGLAFLGANGAGWPQTIALFAMAVYDLHATQAFSDMSGQILPLREAKLHLPAVYAAGTAGSILSGLGLKFLLDGLGIPATFLAIALLLFCADRLLAKLSPFMGGESSEQKNESSAPPISSVTKDKTDGGTPPSGSPKTPEKSAIPEKIAVSSLSSKIPTAKAEASDSPFSGPPATRAFARMLVPMSCLAIFGRILTEFLYTGSLSTFFPSTRDLAAFLGIFGAAIDLSVLGMQTLIGGRVFARYRLGSILGLRGAAMVIACGAGFVYPNIWTIAGSWFVLMALTKAFINPAFVILIEPLPKGRRFLMRRFLSLGDSAANLLAGLTLLGLKSLGVGADPVLFIGVGLVYGVIWLLTFFIDRFYTGVVGETLATAEGQGDLDIIRSVRFIPRGDRIARLSALLGNSDPDVRYRAILEAAELEPHDAAELLLVSMVVEENTRNLSAMTRVILRRLGTEGVEVIEDLLRDDSNVRLQADMIEALSQVGGGRTPEILTEFLGHENHRVRGNAVLGILRQSGERSLIKQSLDILKEMLESKEMLERATAAVVMGNSGLPVFVPALAYLADDPREEVFRQAFQALAGIRTPAALRAISERRMVPGKTGELAETAWKTASAGTDNRLARLLAGLSITARGKIGFWLRSIKGDCDFELLTRILRLPKEETREALISALGNGDVRTRKLIDACLVVRARTEETDPARFVIAEPRKKDRAQASLELEQAGPDSSVVDFVFAEIPKSLEGGEISEVNKEGGLDGGAEDDENSIVCIDEEPLLQAFRETGLDELPAWVELARPIFGARHEGFTRFVREALQTLWEHAVILQRASEWGLSGVGRAIERFEIHFQTAIHLTALTTDDPAGLLDALDKSTAGDSFLHSIALEFLEGRLGQEMAGILFPLLERKSSPRALLEGIREQCGFDPDSLTRDTIEAELKRIA